MTTLLLELIELLQIVLLQGEEADLVVEEMLMCEVLEMVEDNQLFVAVLQTVEQPTISLFLQRYSMILRQIGSLVLKQDLFLLLRFL